MRGVLRRFRALAVFAVRGSAILATILPVSLLAACAAPAPGTASDPAGLVSFDVGGTRIKFEPIDGWCVYRKQQLQQAIAERSSEGFLAHIAYGRCDRIAAGTQYELPADEGWIGTPRDLISQDFGDNREAFANAMRQSYDKEKMAQFLDESQQDLAESIRRTTPVPGDAIKAGLSTDLGVVGNDNTASYSGFIQRADIVGPTGSIRISRIVVLATTLIKGKVLVCYMDLVDQGEVKLDPVLRALKAQMRRLVELNPIP